jgi:peptide/nickel transport system permease protein
MEATLVAAGRRERPTGAHRMWTSWIRRRPVSVILLVAIFATVLMAVGAPWLAPYDPLQTSARAHERPSTRHLLGTDYLGRDVLSRIQWGARISLLVGAVAAAIGALVGTAVGAFAGYCRGSVDGLAMRLADGFMVLPTFFIVLVAVSLFGGGIWILSAVIGFTSWPSVARLVRGEIVSLREREFVLAAEMLGASPRRVVVQHLIPNTLPLVVANGALRAGAAIVVEASVGFLGLGDPSAISLGQMLTNTVQYARVAWWSAVFPGAAITWFVFGFSILGDLANETR